jgi:hypothetical protein
VKLNGVKPLVAIVTVLVLGTIFRIATAPERRQMRLQSAKESCVRSGGEWIKVDNDDACQPRPVANKI